MDRLEALGNQLSQITMYDLKSMYTQAKNMVLNVSEMEAKVREATNDDPWGASSTLMQEIAQGTFNFQQFNEIMPSIYNRFMEKEARQWRQIYKALQLLEYIVKHGSERVVDDARAHLATIKMLRNFHYIDDKGKDQGINIRNRSRELSELLQDIEKIRTERRKAKNNRTKYTGVGNDGSGFGGGSGRYGGFGSDSLGGGGGGYGDNSPSYGGGSSSSYDPDYRGESSFRDQTSRRQFDEYDAGDDEDAAPRRSASMSQPSRRTTLSTKAEAPPPPQATQQPVTDLLGGFDDDVPAPAAPATSTASGADFDDFDEFQTAPISPSLTGPGPAVPSKPVMTMPVPAKPAATPAKPVNDLFSMLDSTPVSKRPTFTNAAPMSPPVTTTHTARPSMSGMSLPSYTSMGSGMLSPTMSSAAKPATPMMSPPATKPASSAGAFDDLWSMSLGSSASKPAAPSSTADSGKKSMLDLQREKAQAGIWGQTANPTASSFGGAAGGSAAGGAAKSGGGFDDLLL